MKTTRLCLVIGGAILLTMSGCLRWPSEPKPINPVPVNDRGK